MIKRVLTYLWAFVWPPVVPRISAVSSTNLTHILYQNGKGGHIE